MTGPTQTLRAATVTQVVKPKCFRRKENTGSDEDTGQRKQSGLKLHYEGTQVVTTNLHDRSTWLIEGLKLDQWRMWRNQSTNSFDWSYCTPLLETTCARSPTHRRIYYINHSFTVYSGLDHQKFSGVVNHKPSLTSVLYMRSYICGIDLATMVYIP